LHPLYLVSHKLHVLGAIFAFVEYAAIAVQQQVRLFLMPEGFRVATHGYDGASYRRFCAEVGVDKRRAGTLYQRAGYLLGGRKDDAAGHGPVPVNVYAPEVALQ
jgi:hypothetical protein